MASLTFPKVPCPNVFSGDKIDFTEHVVSDSLFGLLVGCGGLVCFG